MADSPPAMEPEPVAKAPEVTTAASTAAPVPSAASAGAASTVATQTLDRDGLTEAWGDGILQSLPARAKARYASGRFVAVDELGAHFALPNAAHRDQCAEQQALVEKALSEHFGTTVTLVLDIDDTVAPPASVVRDRPLGGRSQPAPQTGRARTRSRRSTPATSWTTTRRDQASASRGATPSGLSRRQRGRPARCTPGPLRSLIDELGRLPGIGPKSAQRIAFHILKVPGEDARRLADAIIAVKERTTLCDVCFNVAESGALCAVCSDDRRDPEVICVVEDPRDIVAVERTGFKGRYHVLGGALSPLDGIGREQLRLRELLDRIDAGVIREAIVCTNPTIEGEATAMLVARELAPRGVVVSRLASGLPVGGDLEYADELTLGRALEGRRPLEV